MKKKIISLCLLGLATFGGINVFAASSVSTNCSLKGWYTSGSQYHAEATTKAPSNGLKKISVYLSSDNGHTSSNYQNNPNSGNTTFTQLNKSGASRLFSDHIWNSTNSNEEITKSIYLD